MKKNPKFKLVALAVSALSLVAVMSSCSSFNDYATSTSDTHVCVFDGSERGGQKLKFQVAPGAESKKIDENDTVVNIPASNRFYMASKNDATRDPRAPLFYNGFAKGNVPVQVEGQVRFKFNLKLACDWYSKHGRRNANEEGDLAFNARGAEGDSSGWLTWLAENMGVTMQEVTSERLSSYEWPAMVYNYPANADDEGTVPADAEAAEATNIALGVDLGEKFTNRLIANLGGEFFCGIDDTSKDACPPMKFQVVAVHTADPALEQSRQKLETTKQDLTNQELEADLREKQQSNLLRAEDIKQKELIAKLKTAQIQADIDNAKCVPLARLGLDCDGKHPVVIAGNGG